ncbi:unnamed protein product [Paramecium sonneborni]|uniref:Uncharacterized protein n=1 Tax=Paramecium sonneborni TaxID=65129 RepID=A0A8S1PXS4_9CILI|nr:unnamed protein product [Paramecium sonneborni]
MSQLHIVILIVKFIQGESQVRISMNQDYQLMTNSFLINSQDYQANSYFSYGIWSRYTPLGRNNQVGTIGILDSSCFHLHNAMGQSTKLLNFILFDCLEYPAQIIKRQILFKASDENWYSYEAIINNFMYEYTWHYFEITSWPFEKKLQLIFIQDKKTVLNKIIDVRIPYSDIDLQLTFGGGLLIDQYQDIPNLEKGTKFSFFPGKMELQPIYIGMYKKLSDYLLVTKLFTVECQCQFNSVRYANDKDLKFLESYSFTSQYPNCENFGLATWIRITNIKSDISEFTYNVMKLSATFSNSQLANENLAAFQLSYFLSPLRNKILISTYSYTFPLVNLDFSDNPFLIQREIDLYNDIKLWHYLAVGVINNEFTIFITFYEDFLEYYYEMYESVNHFHMVRYQLEYGNIKKQSNYFDVQFKNLNFDNCPFYIDYFNFCHFSCERCDGPTDTDCLSCSESSNRIYIREYKTCICPYDTIDDYQCRGFEQYKFSLNQIDANQSVECLFGYFEFEDQCTKCPSIIQDNFLTCLDCLFNPNTWSKILSCEINLYLNDEGQTSKIINQEKQYFISDGNEFKPCLKCKNYEDTNNSFEDSKQTIKEFQYFCLKNSIDLFVQNKDCFQCYIQDCKLCRITLFKQECIICWQGSKLINGECQMQVFILQPKINCVQPYYLDYQKNCKLCTIENCKYCFEYISNDLTKSTLYLNFNQFDMNEYHKIGCAQCEDNFIFDFQIGKCLQKQPSIENCLRSFINLQNIEVCTLSKYDNFSIAPAISNCLNYIQNCKQCILTPEKEIKCVLCNDGFTASIQTGQCYLCSILNSKTCIEGQAALKDGWVQQIQSFLMQFLNNYFYPTTKNFNKIAELPQECQNGFKPIFTIYCHQYCEPRCLSCIEHNQQFFCNQCPLNYYKQPIRSSEKGKCLQCSQLCLVCQSRTPEEINNINPSFKITDSNSFYTHKCLQKANDQNIVIDPYTNLAKYCYQTQCIDTITFKIDFDYNSFIEIFSKEFYNYYENLINIIYCNEFGIKELFIQVDFKKFNMRECNLIQRILIENNFKQKIFSLQKTHLQLIGTSDEQKQFISYLEIQNFDSVEINSAYFKIQEEFFISLTNDRNPIEFAIMNTIINSKQFNQFEYSLKLNNYKKLTIKNVTYDGLLIINQSLFDYLTLEFDSQILIENLIIQNSQFNYSNLFTFPNLKTTIKIDHLKINNCFFQNSAVFSFSSYLTANVDIIQMQVLNTYFVFSTLIYISGKVKITLSLLNIRNILNLT